MKKLFRCIYVLLSTLLVACQSHWAADPNFGSSVNEAINKQTVNINAAQQVPTMVRGMDGVAAKSTIDNYQNSFIRRNIGNSGNSTNSGANPGNQSSSSFGSSSSINMTVP